jgi:signal transduction histidine kinase
MPRRAGEWMALIRLGLVGVAIGDVAVTHEPGQYRTWAWVVVAFFAASALFTAALTRVELTRGERVRARVLAIVFDAISAVGLIAVFSYQSGSPYRALYFVPLVEAALRFGLVGGIVGSTTMAGATLVVDALGPGLDVRLALVRVGVALLVGLVIGWLSEDLARQRRRAEERAAESDQLRDALGHRVDILEAANRCARALGSSLDLDEAFAAFIREVRGVVPFARMAVVLVEGGRLEVLAAAGAGVDDVFPAGSSRPIEGSIFEELQGGQTVYRSDMQDRRHVEEEELVRLGLRSRLTAPLLVGAQPIGLISFVRAEPDGFSPDEFELVSLIGRLAATAVQNIRAYDAERHTVEELRRLSALRADFVSLVSHELRSPMAAVIGSARTLESRWRELSPEQRQAFLSLIADETTRLANLISEVLDTSRIEAGTFSYTFVDVDLARLVEEAVATASVGQDEVSVRADVHPVPSIRGDRERLWQVLSNLIDNAVKYSGTGETVDVELASRNGSIVLAVRDRGPGIAADQHGIIFEKFGRARGGGAKPGTGLGLFIARSIAEAHGGTLEVDSAPGRGATFTLALPLAPRRPA